MAVPSNQRLQPADASLIGGSEMARQTWSVTGHLKVKESETTGSTTTRPLDNVEVRLEGSKLFSSTGFKSWGETRTDENGFFEIEALKDKTARHLKLECRFKDTSLEIGRPWANALATGGLDGNYNTVWRSPDKTKDNEWSVGSLVFESGGRHDLGNREVRKHATWWFALKELLAALHRLGSWYDFNGRIHVAYPEAVVTGASWAEDITTTAHILQNSSQDHGNIETVLHEVMHLWNYHHNVGTVNWALAACGPNGTHDQQENPNVAFHEGFAEFGAHAILHELWGQSLPTPMSPAALRTRGLSTLAEVERNDDGVETGLYALVGSDNPANLDFWDLLTVFKANAAKGWPKEWEVGNADYGLLRFYAKTADMHPSFAPHKEAVLATFDPETPLTTTTRTRIDVDITSETARRPVATSGAQRIRR